MGFAERKELIALLILVAIVGVFLLFPKKTEAPFGTYSPKKDSVHLLFVGDTFFDRSVRQVGETKGYDFLLSCVKDRFLSYDAVVANLEGPITDNPSVSIGSVVGSPENYTFTFAPEVAGLLKRHNVTIVSLGNNHISNQGVVGVTQTEKYLQAAGVDYFGGVAEIGGYRAETGEPVFRTYMKEQNFSFIAFNEFGGSPAEFVAEQIRSEKAEGRTVIVFAHWGEEYIGVPARVKAAAKLFADSGADLIVGSHPHVVQEHEMIGDTPVYYSLGNFLFDQFWTPEVRSGLALDVTFQKGKVTSIKELKTEMLSDRRVCVGGDLPQE